MIACSGCSREYSSYVYPLRCGCGVVTHRDTAYGDQRRPASHWLALHRYAVEHWDRWSESDARDWYAGWLRQIPIYCDCGPTFMGYRQRVPMRFTTAKEFFEQSVADHNYVSTHHSRKPTMTLEDAYRMYRFPERRSRVQHLISWAEFTRDTLTLTQRIVEQYPNVAGIAGCPRSGMRAAADIAVRLGVPLYEASERTGLRRLDSGFRLDGKEFHGPIVVVEDSSCSGGSIQRMRQQPSLRDLPFYAVYATSAAQHALAGFAVSIELPHWFDWHLFHCTTLLQEFKVGLDWDGVLNEDCPRNCDDDRTRYRAWMDAVKPIRRPTYVPTIITARREVYRDVCMAWLNRYGIRTDRLVMFPGSFQQRARTNVGQWKAEMCDLHGVGMFIESDLQQAETIARIRKRVTISIERAECFGPRE